MSSYVVDYNRMKRVDISDPRKVHFKSFNNGSGCDFYFIYFQKN